MQHPKKYPDWKIDDRLLYRYRRDQLLDPVTIDEEDWKKKLVLPEA